jgi:sarcosine oxidase subunit beta
MAGVRLRLRPWRSPVTERYDVAILGAGLFGAALAFHVSRDREFRTVALDVEPPLAGGSGTDASAGILSVQGWDPWDLALVGESVQEYARLAESEGAPALRRNGGLRVARTELGVDWLHRVRSVLQRQGSEARLVGPSDAGDLLPSADLRDIREGLFTPEDAVVSSTALRDAYLRAATRAGVDVRAVVPRAVPRRSANGRWVLETEGAIEADRLVVATGAQTKRILGELGAPVPLAPFRAQALRLRPRPLLPSFPTLHDLDLNLYLRPESEGRVLVGDGTGTTEEDPEDWNPVADQAFVAGTSDAVASLFGESATVHIESAWAGLCVASPDRFPLVGRVPHGEGLYMASGFNGLGTMRAAGLARRLAEGLRTDQWAELGPSDPLRFHGVPATFGPRPEFPLEGDAPETDLPGAGPSRPSAPGRSPDDVPLAHRLLSSLSDIGGLRWAPLSEWFDPFLPLFARDALRTGGSVEVAEADGVVVGLCLRGSSEGVGSGFTRHRRVAERYLAAMEPGGLYLEAPWEAGAEPVEVFAADLRDGEPSGVLRNPVRLGQPSDLPSIGALLRAELGAGVDSWLATLPRTEETAFVCEREGRVVGVSWLSRVGPFARGHSFVVHPRYRGLGIGTDLLAARMLWLRRTGGRSVVSEIYDGNAASRIAAERAGMALVDRMYHFRPPRGARGGGPTSGAPRTSGSSTRSSPSASRSSDTGP